MASLSDILASSQNIASAVNTASATYLNVQGSRNATAITAATLVKLGAGRVAVVSVLVAGSAVGAIYDTNAATSTAGQIFVIPQTVGVTVLNMPVAFGIVVAPGSNQVITISYS